MKQIVTITEDKKSIVLNTPKTLDLAASLNKLEAADSSFKKVAQLPSLQKKMIWLIHQINYWTKNDKIRRSYVLASERHQQMLGVSPNDLTLMIRALLALGLIKQTVLPSRQQKICAQYAIISPFNTEDENVVQKHFFPIKGKGTKFITKWVANDFKVTDSDHCAMKRISPSKKISKDEEIYKLSNRIIFLEKILNALKIDIPLEDLPLEQKFEQVGSQSLAKNINHDAEELQVELTVPEASMEINFAGMNYVLLNHSCIFKSELLDVLEEPLIGEFLHGLDSGTNQSYEGLPYTYSKSWNLNLNHWMVTIHHD